MAARATSFVSLACPAGVLHLVSPSLERRLAPDVSGQSGSVIVGVLGVFVASVGHGTNFNRAPSLRDAPTRESKREADRAMKCTPPTAHDIMNTAVWCPPTPMSRAWAGRHESLCPSTLCSALGRSICRMMQDRRLEVLTMMPRHNSYMC